MYKNRKLDSLDGYWETRGQEHYVAYVHGDTIDIFWFEDQAETQLEKLNPAYRMSGHFTPPEPGFKAYTWDLTYDYDRTNAGLVTFGSWQASQTIAFENDPFTIRMEYKDGKIFRYSDVGEPDVFYPSSRDHYEVDMTVAVYDMQHELSQLAFPLKEDRIVEVPLADNSKKDTLLFVELTNTNIFRINAPSMLFYDNPANIESSECPFGCYIDAASHVVLVTEKIANRNINAQHRDLVYNEYGVEIVNYDEEPVAKTTDSAVCEDTVEAVIHSDVVFADRTHQISVVFYKDEEIVGGGYTYCKLDNTDVTVSIPIMTDLTDYDWYDIFIY
jgi:hypothetical protein